MNKADYTTILSVDKTAAEVFNAINNVPGWWSANFEGAATELNDSFTVHFGDTWITSKVTELAAGSKVVWLVTDCHKHWLKDKKEWKGTEMIWEIAADKATTNITFTHKGLVPGIECYNGCENAWNHYIKESMYKLITEGVGEPESK